MGMVVPISSSPSPFGELDSGSSGQGTPSEANLLMALATMHKQGRLAGPEAGAPKAEGNPSTSTPRTRKAKSY